MKVKILTEIQLSIPGEFQDDNLAVKLINDHLSDALYVAAHYDDLPDDYLSVHKLNIISYDVLAGRVTQQDIEDALTKQRTK